MAEQVTWIAPDATNYDLTSGVPYRNLIGRSGLFGAPMTMIEQDLPLQSGVLVKLVKATPNMVRIPLLVKGANETDLYTAWAALRYAMNPMRGVGVLRYTSPLGHHPRPQLPLAERSRE